MGVTPILQQQQDKMLGALEKNSKLIYDTSVANLQQILKVLLLDAKEELRKSKEASRLTLLSKAKRSEPCPPFQSPFPLPLELGEDTDLPMLVSRIQTDDDDDDDDDTDDEDDEDEIEKIMEQAEINQEKLRHQLLFGFSVFWHDKHRTKVQLYGDLNLTKLMWRHPSKVHDKQNSVAVSDIIGISVGASAGTFITPKKGLHERRCFSIILEDGTIDLEAPTSKDRAKWVFALRLLVGGLVKSYAESEKEREIQEEEELAKDVVHSAPLVPKHRSQPTDSR